MAGVAAQLEWQRGRRGRRGQETTAVQSTSLSGKSSSFPAGIKGSQGMSPEGFVSKWFWGSNSDPLNQLNLLQYLCIFSNRYMLL